MQKGQHDASYWECSCAAHNPTSNHTDNCWIEYWPWSRVPQCSFGICITCATYSGQLWFSYLTYYSYKPIVKCRIWLHSSAQHSYQLTPKQDAVYVCHQSTPPQLISTARSWEGRVRPETCGFHSPSPQSSVPAGTGVRSRPNAKPISLQRLQEIAFWCLCRTYRHKGKICFSFNWGTSVSEIPVQLDRRSFLFTAT